MEGKRVDSKLLLFTLVLVLITLLLLNYLLNNSRSNGIWDYDNLESAEDVMYQGERITDRETYYALETIIYDYLDSYIVDSSDKENITYEDYYNFLTKSYKKHLSKKEYKEVAERFLNKFYINMDSDYEAMYKYQLLKEIYLLDENVYVCKLESKRNNETGYIALKVDEAKRAFNIVYIE